NNMTKSNIANLLIAILLFAKMTPYFVKCPLTGGT
ncbi:MAG: hypothetical protein ACI8SJ_001340, partial [Shewanella sp.]